MKKVEMQAALRADKYPNITTHLSPKLAIRATPTDALLLRATYENGFRAPNLVESANSTKSSYDSGTSDPLRCSKASALSNDLMNQANSATTQAQYSALIARAESVQAAECSFGLSDIVKNNPYLKPETSKSFSFGAVWEPVKGYSASADYWHIARNNTIGLTSSSQLLSGAPLPAGTTLNRATVYDPSKPTSPSNQPDPTFTNAELAQYQVTAGPLQNVIRQMENISQQSTSGIDISFKGVKDIANVGKVSAIVDGTYNLTFYDTSSSTSTENLVGQYGSPHFVSSLTLVLDNNGFSNSLRFNYAGGYHLQYGQFDTTWSISGCAQNTPALSPSECRVSASKTTDYAFEYTGYKNLSLGINVMNLFQQRSPTDFRAFSSGSYLIPTSLQDAAGRTLRLSLNYKIK